MSPIPTTEPDTRSGLIAVLGRPNVGKSTLVNALVGEKVSIVTHKAQTTRHRIVGVVSGDDWQLGLVDTPGVHGTGQHALNRLMNRTAQASLEGVDAALLVVEAGRWNADDERALAALRRAGLPTGLVVNKVDRVRPRSRLLPILEQMAPRFDFAFVVPISARRRGHLEPLRQELRSLLPTGPFLFPVDEPTDRDMRFLVAETIREKLTLALHQELPYSLAVTVEQWQEQGDVLHIAANIWVARAGHKAIVIGSGGAGLRLVGQRARTELAHRFGRRVDLRLWVKLRDDWPDDEAALRSLGY